VGLALSLEVFCNLGVRLLFFGYVLFDCGLWRRCSPRTWRLLGPVESLTGVLMCGVSAGLLFAIVNRLVEHDQRQQ